MDPQAPGDWVTLGDHSPPFPSGVPAPYITPQPQGITYVKPLDYELVSPPAPADLSKSEEPNDHYLKRYQVYHERKAKFVPFDPADAVPALDLDDQKNEKYYFYVNVRYTVNQRRYPNKEFNQSSEEPWVVLSNFSEPLIDFCKVFIGNTFYNSSSTECAATTFFPLLPEMQDTFSLCTALLSKMKNNEATPEEKLSCAKRLGIVGSSTLSIASASAQPVKVPMGGPVKIDGPTTITENDINQALQTSVSHLEELLKCLEALFQPTANRLEMLLQNGHIEYDLLPYFFKPGEMLTYKDSIFRSEMSAMKVKDRGEQTVYRNNGSPAQAFNINGTTKRWGGYSYVNVPFTQTIRPFSGTKAIADLPVEHITKEREATLRARGKLYMAYSGPPQHRLYHNNRVIVDEYSYSENGHVMARPISPVYDDEGFPGDPFPLEEENTDELELLLPPEVHGFDLVTKQWTSFTLHGLKPVVFDNKAWDHLVLDQDTKTLIKGLVDVTTSENIDDSNVITDVITGKGGGLIALLHGPPGTGKTLTAEAVAEHLQRPLYMVGSSELSTNAPELESTLRRILALATSWNAVMLIDEADIFLEQRSLHEIQRNSLVSVALRVFEYHQGVLFLTTNRIQTFDNAFLSRFSIAIKYPELNAASRFTVWSKFLEMAGCTLVESMNATELSQYRAPILRESVNEMAIEHALNGRTIKNVVKTAQALALSSSKPMSLEHIIVVLRVQAKFLEDFKEQVQVV